MLDIIIKNGIIYDGKKNDGYLGNVGIKDSLIVYLGSEVPEANTILEASGNIISPGFIDIHSHSDSTFIYDEGCESKILQGVTSELTGQCGSTMFPFIDEMEEEFQRYIGDSIMVDRHGFASHSLGEFIHKVENQNLKYTTNQIPLVGHGALRTGCMGIEGVAASESQLQCMERLLDEDMQTGAWGLSLGLGYAPGIFANQEELNRMGAVVAKYDGIITSHMRNQGSDIFNSLDEMYRINEATGCRVHIAHLKMGGKARWGRAHEVYEHIENAISMGVNVTKDMYPYTHSASGITNILPKSSLVNGVNEAAKMLESAHGHEMVEYMARSLQTRSDGEGVYIVSTHGKFPEADDKNLWELSQLWNISMAESAARVIIETEGTASGIFESMSEEDVLFLLSKEDIAIGSDGSSIPIDPCKNEGKPHPRNFGTFPRFFRLVRENKLCDLKTAIHRTTGLSAEIIGLEDRGTIEVGKVADIVVFDNEIIADHATYKNPFQPSAGIIHVVVNGDVAVENGELVKTGMGKMVLKKVK